MKFVRIWRKVSYNRKISKALYYIDHSVLLDKLGNIGVRELSLKLLASYLSDRKQAVFCNNTVSNFKTIKECHKGQY